jgi:hypothetical protein
MPDFLSNVPAAYAHVSPGFVETLLQSRRAELFTGLMGLHYSTGEILVFTFLNGNQQKLYRCLEKNMEVISRSSWQVAMDLPDASVSFMPLTVESLRLMHVAHEAPAVRIEAQALTVAQLSEKVPEWANSTEPSILHLHTKPFDRVYLVSGGSNPVIEGVAFADGASNFSINDTSFPSLLPQADLHVTRYVSHREHSTWQEHDLRLAFNLLMRLVLNRFGELAGRMLTERLCERISNGLKADGWNIRVTLNGVSNRHYFESMEQTVDVYVSIIRSFHDEASPAIGQRMAEGLSHEILPKLDAHRRETIMRYIYDGKHADTVTGRVWR